LHGPLYAHARVKPIAASTRRDRAPHANQIDQS
jgi:hypothetical protein